MDLDFLTMAVTAVPGLLAAVVAANYARRAAAVSRNSRDTAELAGRLAHVEAAQGDALRANENAHRRIGAVGQAADRNTGRLDEMSRTLGIVQERMLLGPRCSISGLPPARETGPAEVAGE